MLVLEVIACSVADAVAAERGGAGRLEIVRAPEAGGLTPPVSLVRKILSAVAIPVRVIVRENSGFEVADEAEIEKLCNAARKFAALPIEGLVVGFLRGRSLHLSLTQQVLSCAPGMKATFHRAFEELDGPDAAVAALKATPQFDRILVSPPRVRGLSQLIARAAPQLIIVAGGGIDRAEIARLRQSTEIREFHVGRAARKNGDIGKPVDADRVRELVALLAG